MDRNFCIDTVQYWLNRDWRSDGRSTSTAYMAGIQGGGGGGGGEAGSLVERLTLNILYELSYILINLSHEQNNTKFNAPSHLQTLFSSSMLLPTCRLFSQVQCSFPPADSFLSYFLSFVFPILHQACRQVMYVATSQHCLDQSFLVLKPIKFVKDNCKLVWQSQTHVARLVIFALVPKLKQGI